MQKYPYGSPTISAVLIPNQEQKSYLDKQLAYYRLGVNGMLDWLSGMIKTNGKSEIGRYIEKGVIAARLRRGREDAIKRGQNEYRSVVYNNHIVDRTAELLHQKLYYQHLHNGEPVRYIGSRSRHSIFAKGRKHVRIEWKNVNGERVPSLYLTGCPGNIEIEDWYEGVEDILDAEIKWTESSGCYMLISRIGPYKPKPKA